MKVEIEIPVHLAGFIWSLTVSELDNDSIAEDIGTSDHFYDLLNTGLIVVEMNSEDEPEYHLTKLGKAVYERKIIGYTTLPVFEGFGVSFIENAAMQDGKAVMMLSPKDYKGLKSKYNLGSSAHEKA